jgi:negative regulator of flagellin synthesis FlgM
LDVTTKITGYQDRPVQVGGDKTVSRGRGGAAGSSESAAPNSPVRITDQARQLAALEQAVQGLPIMNEARVAEIRLAIEEGRYEIAPDRIAEKLLRMDQELRSSEK